MQGSLRKIPTHLMWFSNALFNSHMSKCTFLEELKAGDMTSLFKQENAFSKKSAGLRYGKLGRRNVVAFGIQNLKPGPNQSTML